MPAQAIGHKTPDLETYFSNFLKNQTTKNDKFLKETDNWQFGIHRDLLQLQACQNPLDDQKRKSQDRDTLKSSLIDALGHVDQKLPISR